jgi:hypothetical protein
VNRAGLAAIAMACGLPVALLQAHDPIGRRVTWTGDIARIIQARCVSCHADGGRGPMSLATYEDARPWARAIREEVLARRMPKWHAVRGYGDFRNDPSLSPFEIALIAAWADTGAQKGADAGVPTTSGNAPGRAPEHPVAVREVHVACGRQRIPAGVLLALRPDLDRGESVGIAVRVGSARTDILAWIRDFDPDFTETYWLRTPLHLERAAELVTEGTAACAITLLFSEPRARTGR